MRNGYSRYGRLAKSIVVPALVLLVWEGLSRAGKISPAILPAPSRVVARWWQYLLPQEPYDPAQGSRLAWLLSGELPQDAMGSLSRVVVGFLIGAGLALPLGLLMGRKPLVHELFSPVLEICGPSRPSPTSHSPSSGSGWGTRPRSSSSRSAPSSRCS